ncbi:chordin-like protein, partial [Dinothrombium tinctorium]
YSHTVHAFADCQFGNQSYNIEERWRPNLGPPFGVLFCVHCECIAHRKEIAIVARVRCKNIKNDCPKPNCDNPVLLPEGCCKTCPAEGKQKSVFAIIFFSRAEVGKGTFNARFYEQIKYIKQR